MTRTHSKPGPKPGPEKREYHFNLPLDLASVFEEAVKQHKASLELQGKKVQGTGLFAYVEMVLRDRPEIQQLLRKGEP